MAHKWARWLHHPCRLGDPHRFRAGDHIGSGPQVGKVATSPLPPRGILALQSGGQNQKWPTSRQGGYITPAAWGVPTLSRRGAKSEVANKWQGGYMTPAAWGIPTASQRGAKSEVAHKWARWLHNPRSGGDRPGWSPPLQSEGQNQKRPTSGQGGYITPAASGTPTASERGAKSEVAHKWARWLHKLYRLGGHHRFRARGKIRSAPQVGKVATSPLPPRGSPPLQSKRQNQMWPISGQGGYITSAASGIPTASRRGAKSKGAHNWASWLHHPCRLGDPQSFRAGRKIRSGPQVGKAAI